MSPSLLSSSSELPALSLSLSLAFWSLLSLCFSGLLEPIQTKEPITKPHWYIQMILWSYRVRRGFLSVVIRGISLTSVDLLGDTLRMKFCHYGTYYFACVGIPELLESSLWWNYFLEPLSEVSAPPPCSAPENSSPLCAVILLVNKETALGLSRE